MDKRHLIVLLALVAVGQWAHGQISSNRYAEFINSGKSGTYDKELNNYNTFPILGDLTDVNAIKPIVIKTPKKNERVDIYTFNKIFKKKNYYAVLFADNHPLKPKLITINGDGVYVSELQFLVNFGENRPDYEVFEEVRITDPTDITVTTTTQTWTLDQNGERIKDSNKITTTVDNYQITDNGQIEKIKK